MLAYFGVEERLRRGPGAALPLFSGIELSWGKVG